MIPPEFGTQISYKIECRLLTQRADQWSVQQSTLVSWNATLMRLGRTFVVHGLRRVVMVTKMLHNATCELQYSSPANPKPNLKMHLRLHKP